MIVVADINTSWRRLPFEALCTSVDVLGLEPMDLLVAWRRRRWPRKGVRHCTKGRIIDQPVLMPFGWARNSMSSCRRLVGAAQQTSAQLGVPISGMVVTSPHYRAMLEICEDRFPVYYYCSDDYSSYAGWGGEQMISFERELVLGAHHSFFVSRVLAERAIESYGASPERVSVCPNATSQEFLDRVDPTLIDDLFARYPRLRRPVVGVVGGINERLDFELLLKCAELPEIGTLVMIGSEARRLNKPGWASLRDHPRCLLTGGRPHSELPAWMQLLDAALIPYRNTPMNRACSPMRLFDHLAAGRPIVATQYCEQVRDFSGSVRIGYTTSELLDLLREVVSQPQGVGEQPRQTKIALQHTWRQRATSLSRELQLQ